MALALVRSTSIQSATPVRYGILPSHRTPKGGAMATRALALVTSVRRPPRAAVEWRNLGDLLQHIAARGDREFLDMMAKRRGTTSTCSTPPRGASRSKLPCRGRGGRSWPPISTGTPTGSTRSSSSASRPCANAGRSTPTGTRCSGGLRGPWPSSTTAPPTPAPSHPTRTLGTLTADVETFLKTRKGPTRLCGRQVPPEGVDGAVRQTETLAHQDRGCRSGDCRLATSEGGAADHHSPLPGAPRVVAVL
jgi:hypothetical protein